MRNLACLDKSFVSADRPRPGSYYRSRLFPRIKSELVSNITAITNLPPSMAILVELVSRLGDYVISR